MSGFDPNAFAEELDDDIETVDANISQNLAPQLEAIKGLSPSQIAEFGGTTEEADAIIKVIEQAIATNMSQQELIANLKGLGDSTYDLVKKATDLIP